MTWSFGISLFAIFYAYAGFPLVLVVRALVRNRHIHKSQITPTVSLIITAYNEEDNIAQKAKNVLELDYPSEALEIIIASDGSNDRTNDIVKERFSNRIKLLTLPRRGKIYALTDAVKESVGEILVFSDANTLYHPQALQKLLRNFADTHVGGVCGNQIYLKNDIKDNTTQGEKFYWSYDKWLKQLETLSGSIVSADGAIYAIRRALLKAPRSAAVTDDFAISTAVIEQGYRLVFEREALAYEKLTKGSQQEFNRKVRIINRGLRAVLLRKALLNPIQYGFYSVTLFSHKILRRLVPFFLLLLFITSILLYKEGNIYFGLAVAQALFYGWAVIGYLLRNRLAGRSGIFYIPTFYCLANLAAVVAILKLMTGHRIELWQPQR